MMASALIVARMDSMPIKSGRSVCLAQLAVPRAAVMASVSRVSRTGHEIKKRNALLLEVRIVMNVSKVD